MSSIRLTRKSQFDALLYAISHQIEIQRDMMQDRGNDYHARAECAEQFGSLCGADQIIRMYKEMAGDNPRSTFELPSTIYDAVCHAVNMACDFYSDDFVPSYNTTEEMVTLLIDLNRLDVQLN